MTKTNFSGVGLGLRRGLTSELSDMIESGAKVPVDFMEIAPENWMSIGGRLEKQLKYFTERFPFVCHGLSLSIGSPAPLDIDFVKSVKQFLDTYNIAAYSEHLSYCSDHGHLYDLMPIPFTEEAVKWVASRIDQVQDILERRLIIENVSAYAEPGKEMSEPDFVNAVIREADCDLLLDVNNVYVNSVNHGYDAQSYINAMPTERIRYLHIAGHYQESEDLLIDTHGADVTDPVWDLLGFTYARHGIKPTLLERDFNLPPLNQLLNEVDMVRRVQNQAVDLVNSHA